MKNYIKNLGYIALCATLTFTACSDDRDALIEDLDFDRALSPVDVKATVENIVNVKLTWIAVPNAVSYKIDVYDISEDETGTLTASFASETNNVLITGLGGGTKYRALVTSIGGEGIADSKTSEVTFTTGNEQIFVDIVDADLEINSVIVRWSAGEVADVIYVIDQNNEDAEKLTFEITEEEIEAGAKELTGLNDNTKYKIELRRDGKIRGTLSVTTPEDLSWAIQVAPEEIGRAHV